MVGGLTTPRRSLGARAATPPNKELQLTARGAAAELPALAVGLHNDQFRAHPDGSFRMRHQVEDSKVEQREMQIARAGDTLPARTKKAPTCSVL